MDSLHGRTARVIVSDVYQANGVLFVIDKVLVPSPGPDPIPWRWR